ncbi:MAG: hypothetical protein KC619_28500 [Myxococcales bacterium]|nr:hypothetical protein [Myxococcales bacterium]
MRAWVLGWVALAGCSPAMTAAFVPEAVVDAAAVERVGPGGASWDWRVTASARWRMDREARADVAPAPAMPAFTEPRPAVPCAHAGLCEWERRARLRTLERLLGRSR